MFALTKKLRYLQSHTYRPCDCHRSVVKVPIEFFISGITLVIVFSPHSLISIDTTVNHSNWFG